MTRVLNVDPERPEPAVIEEAARAIKEGKLVAFPTETVYGLGANALDPAAVARIFEAKDRPANDPLIVHIAHIGQLGQCASRVPPGARKLALAFWAGPLTLILPKTPAIADIVTAGLPNVAVRVPAHRVARALMEMAGVPIAAPSANRFSRPSPTTAAHVIADLDGRVDLVVDGGAATIGLESSIVDFSVDPPVLRRPGGLSIEQIREQVPDVQVLQGLARVDQPQLAPGQLLKHYAPRAPMTVYEGEPAAVVARLGAEARTMVAAGERVGILAPEEDLKELAPILAPMAAGGRVISRAYGSRRNPDRAAHELFSAIRAFDDDEVTVILASAMPTEGVGFAIRDRLFRAAEGRLRKA